jgi:hypothetical protein
MSFRRAHDHTLIVQLIGRMVRMPLARRIEGQELLNSVSLYLPHYDAEGLRQVIENLKEDPPTDVERRRSGHTTQASWLRGRIQSSGRSTHLPGGKNPQGLSHPAADEALTPADSHAQH